MDFIDLPRSLTEPLFVRFEQQRRYLERLHQRCVERGFPADDMLRVRVAALLRATREMSLLLVDKQTKGEYRRYMKRARDWPRL